MRNFTQEEAKVIYNDAKSKGLDPNKVMSQLVIKGATFEGIDMVQAKQYAQSTIPQAELPKPTFKEKINEAFGDIKQIGEDILTGSEKSSEKIMENEQQFQQGEQNILRRQLRQTGALASAGANAITAVGKGAVNLLLSDKTEKNITDVIGRFGAKIMANPGVQDIINKYNSLPEEQQK